MPGKNDLPTALTVKEAAPILGVAERTMRIMLNEGAMHGFKVGTRSKKAQWRITTAELDRFMSEGPADD